MNIAEELWPTGVWHIKQQRAQTE